MSDGDLFERWLFAATHRTYHEWVEWCSAEIDAHEAADVLAAAVERNRVWMVELQQASVRIQEEHRRAKIERRLSEIPTMFCRDDGDTFLIGNVWRSRADLLAHPPEWWWDESAPTMISPDELSRRVMNRSGSGTLNASAYSQGFYPVRGGHAYYNF